MRMAEAEAGVQGRVRIRERYSQIVFLFLSIKPPKASSKTVAGSGFSAI